MMVTVKRALGPRTWRRKRLSDSFWCLVCCAAPHRSIVQSGTFELFVAVFDFPVAAGGACQSGRCREPRLLGAFGTVGQCGTWWPVGVALSRL